MKKFSIVVIALLFVVSLSLAQDQLAKGSAIVGGSFSFSSYGGDLYENFDGDGFTLIALDAAYQRFFLDMPLALGLGLGYTSFSQGDDKNSTLYFTPMGTYFFKIANEKMLPFASLAFRINSASMEFTGGDDSGSGTTIGLKGGLYYLLSDHLAVVPALTYMMPSFEWDSGGGSNSGSAIMLSVGLAGFIY